jgi:hypothetical protein
MNRSASLVIIAALLSTTCGCMRVVSTPQDGSPAAAVTGYYEGSLQSRQYGEVLFSINLRDENGLLSGSMITPLGNFPLSQDSLTRERLALRFVVPDGESGTIAGEWGSGQINGVWRLGEDGGAVSLRRTGPSRAAVEAKGPTLDLLTGQWREDLHHLAAELPRSHGNAFHTTPRDQFEDSVRALEARLPDLRGHEILTAMGRIVAMVGDGHTYLELPQTLHRYPIRLYSFGDTLRIVRATAGHEQLLGGRVVGIDGMGIEQAKRLVGRQIARENDQYVLRELPGFLTYAELLHAHGVIQDVGNVQWTIDTTSGQRTRVELAPIASDEEVRWASAAQAVPQYRQRPGEDLWYSFLPETGTLYVGFRGYPARPAFRDFFDELFRFADLNPVERMLIDLRENPGGDFTKTRDLLLPRLKAHPLNTRGRLFVAIGRSTFSAAMTNAADFLKETNATLVGEPTGARPNGWQEKGEFLLPNSNLAISVSTRYYRFMDDDASAVAPHQHIPLMWEDFRAGRDPVLEWVLAQPLPR